MREIKFRAWDKEVGMMHPLDKSINLEMLQEGIISHDGNETFIDCVYMQYTGLKDKRGKEIYEGDILATSNDGKDGADKWGKKDNGFTIVQWNDFCDSWTGSEWNWDKPDKENGTGGVESIYDISYCEVIGNIYENPELLGGVK